MPKEVRGESRAVSLSSAFDREKIKLIEPSEAAESGVTCSEVRLGQLFETGSKGLGGSEMRWKDGQVLQIRCYLKLLYSRLNQLDFQFVLRATRYRKATEIFNRLRGFVTKYYFNPFYQRRRARDGGVFHRHEDFSTEKYRMRCVLA